MQPVDAKHANEDEEPAHANRLEQRISERVPGGVQWTQIISADVVGADIYCGLSSVLARASDSYKVRP